MIIRSETEKYDLIIIGAGPTGISCAIAATHVGLNVMILEKGVLVNSIYHFPTQMTFFSTSINLEIGGIPFISHYDKPTRTEALEYYRRVVAYYDLPIHYHTEVKSVGGQDGDFTIETNKNRYYAKKIIVSTGFYDHARKLNIPGEDLPKVKHYYDDAHRYIGQKVAIIGGANSACDVALETWHKGADVTMIVRNTELYQKTKYWILPNIENRIKEGSIKAYFNSQVTHVLPRTICVSTLEGKIELENDFVLAMTGYQPNYHLLDKLGIGIENGSGAQKPIYNAEYFESDRNGIYIAGVLQAGMNTSALFIENTRHHGEVIVSDILKNY